MTAVLRKTLADLRRRRLQSVVIAVVVLLASGTATLALTLLLNSSDPYDQAFARQRGAHVVQEFHGNVVRPAQLRATAHASSVAAAAGPWAVLDVTFEEAKIPPAQAHLAAEYGRPKFDLELVERAQPGGPVDDLRLTAGRWPRTKHEVVVTRTFAQSEPVAIGDRIVGLTGSGRPSLTIVGEVIDVDGKDAANQNPQHAWVLPGAISSFLTPGVRPDYQMAYRFHRAATSADLLAALKPIQAMLPNGALGFTFSYIDVRNNFNITNSLILTFLLAFSVFALGAAALIIANIVTGAVVAGYRDIGIMKAVGYTPTQVVMVLIGQMVLPSLAACAVGIPLGVLLSQPLLDRSADALGLPAPSVLSGPVILLTLAGVVVVVCVAAGLPAWRAGLLSPIRAIVAGTAPESRKGVWLTRRLAAIGVPQALRLGIGQSFARPLRAGFTMVAVLIGVATVTFAYGLRSTIERGLHDPGIVGDYQFEVSRINYFPDARAMQILRAQPQTRAIVAQDWEGVAVDGISQPVQAVFTRGNIADLEFRAEQGRLFHGRGEVVAPGEFLREAHLRVGDYFYGSIEGHRMRFHLVGTIFDTSESGRILHMDFSNLAAADPGRTPSDYLVRVRPGSNQDAFTSGVYRAGRDALNVNTVTNNADAAINTITIVVVVLALVLAAIAMAAIFNTVLLNTRERVRDMAILKAVGMSPRQTMAMVATSAGILGLIGGIVGIPVGVTLHDVILQAMAQQIGNDISPLHYQVYGPLPLSGLVLAGVAVAIVGSYLPARWAARTPVADVLHAE